MKACKNHRQYNITDIRSGAMDPSFHDIYADHLDLGRQRARYTDLAQRCLETFKNIQTEDDTLVFFSTPGRTELGGNHTDNNHGNVLAGSIQLDTIAAVIPTGDLIAVIASEGFPIVTVDLSDLEAHPEEVGTTDALLRGYAAGLRARGYAFGGFRACTTTDVLKGSGLSSSAAIEILIGTIFNALYNENRLDPIELALIGKFAENVYFGKPSGLMDQLACAHGGIIGIDFLDPAHPAVCPIEFDFQRSGYTLFVVDTGGNHADLTPAYAAVTEEMGKIAKHLGKQVCRGLRMEEIIREARILRELYGDRAVLRVMHFINENERAVAMAKALQDGAIDDYLMLVRDSGNSSYKLLQNLYPSFAPHEQGLRLAIAWTEQFLDGEGACRVHGGGFAGTIQAYVPNERVPAYREMIESVFGPGHALALNIRSKRAGSL